ncbi:MAG: sugar phosphate isomerase/epimerase [Archaeoglobaceae archaeon]|nr:sugar phosphate isomerase/epimerase [Archaeoglobaceae archaeon]MCX8152155.1 sugar phosphate isomerase/epimerase [Archaeoglobaceae archaeon]MDW8013871.1 sugar phosphate isomerase/epimerase [Archaeoglobaceae archaeon]
MKIGIQPDVKHKPEEAFEFAAKNGFDHLEILIDHPYYRFLDYTEILEMMWSYDLDLLIHAPSTSTNFISLSENMRRASYKELSEVCFLAEKCYVEVVTFHLGWNATFVNNGKFYFMKDFYEEHNERVILKELLPFLKDVNVQLALENTILIEGKVRKALELVMEETELKLTLDIGHYNIQEDPFFMDHFDDVVNIHVHDNNGKLDEHLALGKGKVDLRKFPIKNYDKFLTIETRDERAIIETFEYLKEVIT